GERLRGGRIAVRQRCGLVRVLQIGRRRARLAAEGGEEQVLVVRAGQRQPRREVPAREHLAQAGCRLRRGLDLAEEAREGRAVRHRLERLLEGELLFARRRGAGGGVPLDG